MKHDDKTDTGRQIINIYLPKELKEEADKAVKSGGYVSRSEFFRHLLWELRGSREDIANRKVKELRSLKDLC